MTKTAVILAAGQGQRMRPLSHTRPKGMFLLAGRPVIDHVVDAFKALGVERFIVVVDPDDALIRAHLADGQALDTRVDYVIQGDASGTAEALRLVPRDWISDGTYVVPANVFVDSKTVQPLLGATWTTMLVDVASRPHEQCVPVVRGDKLEATVIEKPAIDVTRVSTGIHWLDATTLGRICDPAETESYLDALLGALASELDIRVLAATGPCEALIDPWDMIRINDWAMREVETHIGSNADIDDTAVLVPPVWIGDGCHIGERAVVGPNVALRTNARVGALSELRDSIVNSNVRIDTRAVIRGAILDDGVGIGPGFLAPNGVIIGSDASIGAGVIYEGPTILEAGAKVASGTVVANS